MKKIPLIAVALLTFVLLQEQSIAQSTKSLSFPEVLPALQKHYQVKFFYKPEWIEKLRIEPGYRNIPLKDFLNRAFAGTTISYVVYQDHYVILFNGNQVPLLDSLPKDAGVTDATFRPDGKTYTISGHVKEANTGESIIGASIFVEELKSGVTTNTNGYFSLSLVSGIYNLRVSALGKAASFQKVYLSGNQSLNLELFDQLTQLNDVVISGEAMDHNVTSVEMSLVKMDVKTLKTIPAFLGEADVVRSILLLPGVSTVGEGASGFNVRGGNVDQNLILFDDVPIFNSSHLFGFFSTFNSDVIKDVTLYKAGMPAQYGGRISSVLDVKSKTGNVKKLSGGGGLGAITSRLFLEGPIASEKTSFVVAGRFAYPDWILDKMRDINLRRSSGYFYDANLQVSHTFNDRNSVMASAYISSDGFKLASDTLYSWSTRNLSVRWNTMIGDKIVLNIAGIYGDYAYSVEGTKNTKEFTTNFGINTTGAKIDGTFFHSLSNKIDFGVGINRYQINPGKLTSPASSSINEVTLQKENSLEYFAYISDEYKLNSKITLHGGVRVSQYANLGPSDVYIYEEGVPRTPNTVVDTISYSSGQPVKTYTGFEPRLSARIAFDERSSIKLSYTKTIQYLHLVSNTTAVSPLDLWKSSNYYIEPETGHQFAIGYFRNLKNNSIEASVETYYKEVDNMLEYKDGADLLLNQHVESAVLPAFGKAYGVELLLRKKTGKLTGWVGYTYARTFRQVKGKTEEETINEGRFYPSNFDKPHDITIVSTYQFTRRLSLSANFTYSTGRPISLPSDVYIVDGYTVVEFSERNQGRIPDYHRLDLSVTLDQGFKLKKKWKGSWNFSIYNVYGRKNPYSVFFKPEFNGKVPQAYRLAVLGTIFPSISYNFKF
jgi:hypothetical protein